MLPHEIEEFHKQLQDVLGPVHSHQCGSCGHTFSHGESCAGSRNEHLCPECGEGPWWVRTNVRRR